MATKSAQQEPEKAEVIEELLETLDKTLDRVKVLYEQYFLGIQKQPPTVLHNDLERKLRELTQLSIRNTALRYRFATITQKFGSYNTYWRRTLRQIEAGTYVRNLSKIGRQAARTGDTVPEEILAAMPKRMREQVKRDREAAVALDKVRKQQSDELLTLAEEDMDDDDAAAFIREPSELRRNALRASGVLPVNNSLKVDEGDADFDVDAFFASVIDESAPEPDLVSAPPIGPPRAKRRTAAPRPIDEDESTKPIETRPLVTAQVAAPAARGQTPPSPMGRGPATPPPAARGQTPPSPMGRGPATPPPAARGQTPPSAMRGQTPPSAMRGQTPPSPQPPAARAPQSPPSEPAPSLPPIGPPRPATPVPQTQPIGTRPLVTPPSMRPAPPVAAGSRPAGAPPPPTQNQAIPRFSGIPAIPAIPSIPKIPTAPSQMTKPIPVVPGALDAKTPVSVETLAGPFARVSREPEQQPPPAAPRAPASERTPPPQRMTPPQRVQRVPPSERTPAPERQPPPPGMTDADVNALYAKYVKAKELVGEPAGPGAYGKLLKTINAQAPKIMEQYKSKGVDFSIVVKDNQVIIRAKPK